MADIPDFTPEQDEDDLIPHLAPRMVYPALQAAATRLNAAFEMADALAHVPSQAKGDFVTNNVVAAAHDLLKALYDTKLVSKRNGQS